MPTFSRSILVAVLLAALPSVAAPARAANPYIVRLLEPQVQAGADGSFPGQFGTAGDLAYFVASTRGEGQEIWRSDGTAAGTLLLGDLCPGPCHTAIELAGAAGGRMTFVARPETADRQQLWSSDGTIGGTVCLMPELDRFSTRVLGSAGGKKLVLQVDLPGSEGLWASDGTPAGTLRLRPFPPQGPFLLDHLPFGDGFLFVVDDGAHGHELWRTDGTAGGTFLLSDVEPGPDGSFPRLLTPVEDQVYFVAGGEIWRTDGTPGGTVRVAEPSAGGDPVPPSHLTAAGDRLFFFAGDESFGPGLWVSDGTAGGTRLLASLRRTNAVTEPLEIVAAGNRAWATVSQGSFGHALWVSDGAPAGTHLAVEDVFLRPLLDFQLEDRFLQPLGERVVFNSDGGVQDDWEPWVSDGTPGGTRRLADLCPGSCSGDAGGFWPYTGLIYFRADDELNQASLWRTDGTPEGTFELADACASGSCFGDALALVEWRGALYFSFGFEAPLWRTDGTVQGTVRLQDEAWVSSQVAVETGDRLLFAGGDSQRGAEPWATDGTAAGTRILRDLEVVPVGSGELLGTLTFSNRLLQITGEGFEWRLWSSDGTAPGTVDLVRDQPGLGTPARIGGVRAAGDRAYFMAEPEFAAHSDLWITDGTRAGTRPLTDFSDGPRIPNYQTLGTLGERVFFFAEDPDTFVSRLWVSDGTVDGTLPLLPLAGRDPFSPPESGPTALSGVVGGRLVFAGAPSEFEPLRLWRSDGTAAGTRPLGSGDLFAPGDFAGGGGRLFYSGFADGSPYLAVTDGSDAGTRVLAGPFLTAPAALTAAGGRLFFAADDGQGGEEPWTSDGTVGGTRRVADLHPGAGSSRPREMRAAGQGRVYFVADDGAHGRELWISNGTRAGTRMVADLLPGAHGSSPASLAFAGGRVYFAANTPLHGRELWRSDGTAAGTELVADLAPGPESADPRALTVAGDRIFFHAASDRLDRTLWAWVWRGAAPASPPAAPVALTTSGPVEGGSLELSWQDRASDEAFYVIESTSPDRPWEPVAYLTPDTRERTVFLAGTRPTSFRVRAENGAGASAPSNEVSATRVTFGRPCVANDETLCLLDDRFAVRVAWQDQRSGAVGIGRPAPLPGSDRTGTFWFFDPANVELIVKALDGRPFNGAFWSFFGALSDVEYWVTVIDTELTRSRTYHNPPGEICGVGDTAAFPAPPGTVAPSPGGGPAWRKSQTLPLPGTAGACLPGPETLCLLDGRLKVEVAWNDHHNGGSGPGRAVPGTDKTGYFWFFSPSNVELVVKALDGTPVNGHLWVFWGALSDVEYTITVTDTETGLPVEYHNPPGEICGGADTAAF